MVCDHVAIIVDGRIRYEGGVEDVVTGSGEQVDVVLASLPPDAALALEEKFSARLRGMGERVEVRVAEKEVNDVLGLALAAGGEVISVSPQRVSLESFFLSAVEGGDTEEGR
jgi:ABC-type multidrug transport system ATPase subunit